MKKKEFIARATAVLRDNDARKRVAAAKHTFHISDDDGNKKDFVVKKAVRGARYNNRDVGLILDAFIEVLLEAMRHGEPIEIRGIGELVMKYRNIGWRKSRATGERIYVEGKYAPRLRIFSELKKCAAVYQAAVKDGTLQPMPSWSVTKGNDEDDWTDEDDRVPEDSEEADGE